MQPHPLPSPGFGLAPLALHPPPSRLVFHRMESTPSICFCWVQHACAACWLACWLASRQSVIPHTSCASLPTHKVPSFDDSCPLLAWTKVPISSLPMLSHLRLHCPRLHTTFWLQSLFFARSFLFSAWPSSSGRLGTVSVSVLVQRKLQRASSPDASYFAVQAMATSARLSTYVRVRLRASLEDGVRAASIIGVCMTTRSSLGPLRFPVFAYRHLSNRALTSKPSFEPLPSVQDTCEIWLSNLPPRRSLYLQCVCARPA